MTNSDGKQDMAGRPGRGVRIQIRSRSDREEDLALRLMWGDHWVKEELSRELRALGFEMVESDPDVFIHFFGGPGKTPPPDHTLNLVWLYSHPDLADARVLEGYRRIYCASQDFIPQIEAMGCEEVTCCPACTSKRPAAVPVEYDIVFLGNARASRPDGRAIVGHLGPAPYRLKVWGNLWETILPPENIGGRYWDYRKLENLYASARIVLNDHNHDMAREGFVSNKVFDILASGGFVISDRNPGLERIFGDAVPQYESPDHLKELVRYYLANETERQAMAARGRAEALKHTYRDRARQFAADIRADLSL